MRGTAYIEREEALARLGFYSYAHYLKSELWSRIRSAKLAATPACELCDRPAACVHHLSYRQECLRGNRPHHLVCLCDRCHRDLEFSPDGRKRTFEGVLKRTRKLLKRRHDHYDRQG